MHSTYSNKVQCVCEFALCVSSLFEDAWIKFKWLCKKQEHTTVSTPVESRLLCSLLSTGVLCSRLQRATIPDAV